MVFTGAPPSELRQEQRPIKKEYAKTEAPRGSGLSRVTLDVEGGGQVAKQAHPQCGREVT